MRFLNIDHSLSGGKLATRPTRLIAQQVVQMAQRIAHAALHRADRAVHHFRNLRVTQALHKRQFDHGAMIGRQARQGRADLIDLPAARQMFLDGIVLIGLRVRRWPTRPPACAAATRRPDDARCAAATF